MADEKTSTDPPKNKSLDEMLRTIAPYAKSPKPKYVKRREGEHWVCELARNGGDSDG